MTHCVRVTVASLDEEDLASGRLWASGALGIEHRPGVLIGTFSNHGEAASAAAVVGYPARLEPPAEVDWLRSSRSASEPVVAGPLWIAPPWSDAEAPDGAIAMRIDPGPSFGHGGHPTTRLILEALAAMPPTGRRVLDVGSGSGVLSVASAVLGARSVTAIDIDPDAVAATNANAAANGWTEAIEVHESAPHESLGHHDLALVNLTVDRHEEIGPTIAELAPRVLASGILAHQVDRTDAAYPSHEVAELDHHGEWTRLRLDRR